MQRVLFRRVFHTNGKNGLFMTQRHKGTKAGELETRENLKLDQQCLKENYPEVEKLELPPNYRYLPNWEKTGFSGHPARDLSAAYIAAYSSDYAGDKPSMDDSDPRIGKYGCSGSVNLSSSMQTTVPIPFRSKGKHTHFNMPGGHLRQQVKYVSGELLNFHYVNLTARSTSRKTPETESNCSFLQPKCSFSSDAKNGKVPSTKESNGELVKRIIREYGITAGVVHITLSAATMGLCLLLVQQGMDLDAFIKSMGWNGREEGVVAVAAATPFIIAYTFNKVTLPYRACASLCVTVFLVNFLKKRGIYFMKK